MTDGARVVPLFEFEAFGAAVGSAVVCGSLSVLVPLLVAPTATLAALALAGWVSLARRQGSLTRNGLGTGSAVALSVLAAASLGFLASPPLLAPFRGLLLAGSLVPLFVTERTRSTLRSPVFSRP
ncbi:MAG TPA: hypothetical protein VGG32_10925 [Thermoplasmata archaeon]|jgi:hypothetical protein